MSLHNEQLPDYMQLLPAETLAQLGRMEFRARSAVAGSITGRHKSPYKGFSVEFAEHRAYVPGDDPRDLDWRVYGRIDRYYIKQYVEETNLRATILLDASASMRFVGTAAAKIDSEPGSKFEYARRMAAMLSYVLIRQQDAVGLVTFDAVMRRYVPARSRPSQLRVVLEELNNTEPGGETDLATIFHDIAERIPRRGLVVILSDLFGPVDSIIEALQHFCYRKHQVMLLHVMADEELTFPFDRWTNFRNIEDFGMQAQLDPKAIRAAYLDRMNEYLRRIDLECGRMQIDYLYANTRSPCDTVLANYLANRC